MSRFKQRYIGEVQLDAYRTVTKPSEGLLAQGASPEVTTYHLGVGTLFGYAFPMALGELKHSAVSRLRNIRPPTKPSFLIPRCNVLRPASVGLRATDVGWMILLVSGSSCS
ncbi:MAG: hypothetical protein R3C68_02110 [Myxococcota bacterium]